MKARFRAILTMLLLLVTLTACQQQEKPVTDTADQALVATDGEPEALP